MPFPVRHFFSTVFGAHAWVGGEGREPGRRGWKCPFSPPPSQDSPAKRVEWSYLRGHKTGARPPLRQGEVKRSAWPLLALCLPFRVAMGQLATVSRKVHVPVGCTPAHHPHWLCGSGDRAAIGSQSGPGLSGREQMGFLPPHTLASSPGDCHQSLATPAASLESGGRRVHGRPAVSACE